LISFNIIPQIQIVQSKTAFVPRDNVILYGISLKAWGFFKIFQNRPKNNHDIKKNTSEVLVIIRGRNKI
jgi:hypothetical protein